MEIAGFISIGVLIVSQIVIVAYQFGRISSKVSSIEKSLNDLSHSYQKLEERIGRIEGRGEDKTRSKTHLF